MRATDFRSAPIATELLHYRRRRVSPSPYRVRCAASVTIL